MAGPAVQKHVRPWRVAVILTTALLALAAAAPALGATVTQAPTVSGDAATGSTLTASAGQWTPAGAQPSYDWLRCNAAGAGCRPVAGACDRRYTVRAADVGHRLRARLTVTEAGGPRDSATSEATKVVVFKPYFIPTGNDTGQPCVVVTPTGPGEGTFTAGGATGAGTTPAPDTSLRFIDPFPVVRIAGRFRGSRTSLTRVSVRAPAGTRIRVACDGRGCPYRRRTVAARLLRVRSLQRSYAPRATIEIRVTQPHRIGKYTRLKTRRGKVPLRIDRCLMPGSTRPVRCPAA
jgi:hypothetical protein